VLCEAPDDVLTAGLLATAAPTEAFTSVPATKLVTVDEALDALRRAAVPGTAHQHARQLISGCQAAGN
jgi:hypothetical protein